MAEHYKHMDDQELFKLMAGSSCLKRKNAAKELAVRVKHEPASYVKYIPELIDALARPEAQTRWECLNALTSLCSLDSKKCKAAIDGAEDALFDEKTSLVRVAAIRFLCRYGAQNTANSKEVWELIKEALNLFHGEIEFDEMLKFVVFFAKGKLSSIVEKELKSIVDELIINVGPRTKFMLSKVDEAMKLKNKKKPSTKKSSKKEPAKKETKKKADTTKKAKKPAKKVDKKKTLKKVKKDVEKKIIKKAVKKAVEKKIDSKQKVKKKTKAKSASSKKNNKSKKTK